VSEARQQGSKLPSGGMFEHHDKYQGSLFTEIKRRAAAAQELFSHLDRSATYQIKSRLQESAKEGCPSPFYLFCFQTIVEFPSPSLDSKKSRFRQTDKQSNVVQEKISAKKKAGVSWS